MTALRLVAYRGHSLHQDGYGITITTKLGTVKHVATMLEAYDFIDAWEARLGR